MPGTGPAGRITHEDLDAFLAQGPSQAPTARPRSARTSVEDIKVVGLRRRIAEKMALANARIPHITYVEEVDVTALEELRATLNKDASAGPAEADAPALPDARDGARLSPSSRSLNALFDDEAGIVHQHAGVHIGIATQTPAGLMVPVVRHAEARDLWDCAAEVEPARRSRARAARRRARN